MNTKDEYLTRLSALLGSLLITKTEQTDRNY